MTKTQKSNKVSILIIFSLILFVIATIMVLISTSKIVAKKEKLLDYREKSYIDYEIKRNDNNMIKEIFFDFNYSFFADRKLDIDYDYDITAEIIATNKETSKILYYNQVVLIPSKKVGVLDTVIYNIKESLNINYEEYNEMLKENFKKYDLNNIDAYFIISLNTNTISSNFTENLKINSISTINIPLLNNDIEITKQELNELNNLIGIKDEVIKNKNLFVISIIMASLAAIILILAFILFLINPTIVNSYNKEYKKVMKIIRDYDELIKRTYKMPSLKDKKIIEVFNIDDFIAFRDKYELTFTMIDKENMILFVMVYNNKVWRYSIDKK